MPVPATLLIALAAQLTPLAAVAIAATYTVPTSGTIERLQRDHSPRGWFMVTSDSMRWKSRVRRFDEVGLVGLRPSDATVRPPDPFPWTRVERISVIRSRRTSGVLLGVLVGGVGTVALARSGDFFFAGALGGGALGGVLGGRVVHEEDLYRATMRGSEPSPVAEVPALAARSSPPPGEVDRIALLLHPSDVVRIAGGGTTHYGHVGVVSVSGLGQFRPEPSLEHTSAPLDLIPWEQVDRLDRRVGSSGSGAKGGAIGFGVAGVLLGMAVGAAANALAEGNSEGAAMAAGGAIGGLTIGALGGLIGAGIGAGVPRWEAVFVRR